MRMRNLRRIVPHGLVLLAVVAGLTFSVAPVYSQQAGTPPPASMAQTDVKLVIGGENIKNNSVGTLSIVDTSLQFTAGKKKLAVPAASILDIFTNEDSRQDITGVAELATIAIPYGGGRVLSLFSHGVDVLTLEFKDANSAYHGAVFVLPKGQAAAFKKQLVELGAKASIPLAPAADKGAKN